ncbi:MAG: hypothetical protein ACPH5I_03210 [Amylibacter sp.]
MNKLRIGFDLDNTIIDYSDSFKLVAISLGLVPEGWRGNKAETKSFLCKQPEGEKLWMRLQGKVYGEFLHLASISPGLKRFLKDCSEKLIEMYIISHKTEIGHFDEKKINLRNAALEWLTKEKIISQSSSPFSVDRVHFAGTQNEKIKIISAHNLDFFIDDLPEIFSNDKFPISTQAVGFGCSKSWPKKFQNEILISKDWDQISKTVLKNINFDKSYWYKLRSKLILNDLGFEEITDMSLIKGGKNSQVWKFTYNDHKKHVLKLLPGGAFISDSRINKEIQAQEFFRENNISNIGSAVVSDIGYNAMVFKYISGTQNKKVDNNDILGAMLFLLDLQKNQNAKVKLNYASDASKSIECLKLQIISRRARILKETDELDDFFNKEFNVLFNLAVSNLDKIYNKQHQMTAFNTDQLIVSPSDFGFHNAIFNKGLISWLDFEHFGLDDPVKTIADFIWHPGMNLSPKMKKLWFNLMEKKFLDEESLKRYNVLYPFVGLKWICIVLNEFISENWERRKYSQPNAKSIGVAKDEQLLKAKNMLKKVRANLGG